MDTNLVGNLDITYDVYLTDYPTVLVTSNLIQKFSITVKNPCEDPVLTQISAPPTLDPITYYIDQEQYTYSSYESEFTSSNDFCGDLNFSVHVLNQDSSILEIIDPNCDLYGKIHYGGVNGIVVQSDDLRDVGDYTIKVKVKLAAYPQIETPFIDMIVSLKECFIDEIKQTKIDRIIIEPFGEETEMIFDDWIV